MKSTTLVLALCLALPTMAQEATPNNASKFYRLDFSVKELDDNKLVSTKSYTTYTAPDSSVIPKGASIRTGNRIPYSSGGNTHYADVGVNIDVPRSLEVGGQLAVTVAAEVSTIPAGSDTPTMVLPIIRTNRWNSTVLIPVGKPTLLFSSDDLNSKRKLQLEVTATLVK